MSLEINIPLYGTEITLRPVSAKGYLKSLENAEKAAAGKENAEYIKKTYFWADMIAQSAFLGEEKLFSSGEEALEKMTMEDIAKIGGEIFEEIGLPELPQTGRDQAEKEGQIKNPAREADIGGKATAGKSPEGTNTSENIQKTDEREMSDGANYAFSKSEARILSAEKRRRRSFMASHTAESGGTDYRESVYYLKQDLKRVSDFFEKDSRRFDGTFR